jgi:Zn-dependent peptidase ImmA (M78 family)
MRTDAEIERTVAEVLQRHRIVRPPVPVDQIVRALGAELRYVPYEGELSGMLYHERGTVLIAVNSLHHPNRRRFTIAHECAHLLLHKDQDLFIDRGSIKYNRDARSAQGTDRKEVEANRFAAELLMPRKFLEKDLSNMHLDVEDEGALEQLAKKYEVSVQALAWRINRLFGAG